MPTTASFFYITTNLVVRCIPGREGGSDFDNNNDKEDNNNDKVNG